MAVSRPGELSFAVLAGHLINQELRLVLAYWRPAAEQLDGPVPTRHRSAGRTASVRSRTGTRCGSCSVGTLRTELLEFTDAFAKVSGGHEFVRVQLNEDRLTPLVANVLRAADDRTTASQSPSPSQRGRGYRLHRSR